MYKLLLSLRYLRTRWIALASVVSVMLGVATLIVVNSVMGGFATEMRERLRGLLAHVIIEGGGLDGFEHADAWMRRIERVAGDKIEAMTPVVETFGMILLEVNGKTVPQPVQVIGVDPAGRAAVGKFTEYLRDPRNRKDPSFEIRPDVRRISEELQALEEMEWSSRSPGAQGNSGGGGVHLGPPSFNPSEGPEVAAGAVTEQTESIEGTLPPRNPFESYARYRSDVPPPQVDFEREVNPKSRGIIIPWLLATFRDPRLKRDVDMILPGFQVRLIVPDASFRDARYERYTVVDRIKTGMSEYDRTHCYLDIRDLQELRGRGDMVTSIQLKLKDYSDAPAVVSMLSEIFPPPVRVLTWEQKQGPLLSAVAVETRILNILLFMIIAVAGFGILAIFFMIVVEKTRDIGILKALGASDRGVQGIFLSYGFALGAVGSGLGMTIGLLIVIYLDKIETWLSRVTGHEVFSRDLYYFDKIPTLIDPFDIAWIVVGTMVIAVGASVLPARRAAALRPVEALRYE